MEEGSEPPILLLEDRIPWGSRPPAEPVLVDPQALDAGFEGGGGDAQAGGGAGGSGDAAGGLGEGLFDPAPLGVAQAVGQGRAGGGGGGDAGAPQQRLVDAQDPPPREGGGAPDDGLGLAPGGPPGGSGGAGPRAPL